MSYVHPPSDVSAGESHGEGGHGGGLLGKLKDKTKKATSKIKTKVGRRHDDPTDTDPHYDEEEYEESPHASSPLTTPGSQATPFDQKSYDSKPSAFDAFEHPAPASSYTNTASSATSFQPEQSQPSPLTSHNKGSKSQDVSAGSPYDSSYNKVPESDAVIPEGILKTKPGGFDTEGDYPAGSMGVDEPSPSPYATGLSGAINAGTPYSFGDNKVNESETKVPEGIVKPVGSTTQTTDDMYSKPEESDKVNDGAYYSKFGAEGALGRSLGGKDDDELSARERMSKSGYDGEDTGYGTSAYDSAKDTKDTVSSEVGEGYEKAKDKVGMNQPSYESTSDYPDVPSSATEATYQAKDHVQEKAHDLNNATDANQTYTEKATNTAYAAKDKVADTLGLNQPSTGPTFTEKAKDTLGYNQPSTGPTFTERAKDTLGMNQSSTGPSVVDQAKGYLGAAADTTRDQAARAKDDVASYTGAATDTSKDYAGSASDTTRGNTGSAADTTRDTSYQAKDTVQSKAADVNNATDDSETYTQKAANTAYDVKDKAANALGLTQPSTGPSLLDKAKGYLGGAADTTKDYAGSAADNTREGLNQPSGGSLTDTIKGYTGSAVDTTKDNAQRATDATNDYAGSAAENTRQGLNQPSTGPSMLDKAKGYLGVAADTTMDSTGSAVDTSKEYAGKAYDNTAPYGQTAKGKVAENTAVARDVASENAVAANDNAAEAAQRATEVAKDYGAKSYDASAQYGQVAKEKVTETAAVAKDKAVEVTTPKPEDKGLSEKITEALSNLPFQAKDTAAATAQNVAQTTTDKAHEEAHKDTVLGRLTGLLGFGSKQPATHDVNPASQVTKDYTSPAGSARDDTPAAAPHDVPSSGPTQ
ncbi:uncharacterized protein [Physcomitrium patens]|uniref:Uncharacterized protein n=1 Tax=Physcomitrium patens TaxID=3218 RepID=A0A2K1JXX8_PHYPA|nr:uncharacterized protein LOC112287689 [Physcomitrium patens]PNR46384.1 hypothetical protein PHYPA_013503 [Physcomitrium patens]|eukprot:XP_024386739.1 uncharacterized protein LOC112287689 [Physcomitrella patens]